MQIPERRTVGFVLLAAVLAIAGLMYLFGPGLIWTDYPSMPAQAAGITLVKRTNLHLAAIPLGVIAGGGFYCLATAKRAQTPLEG